MIVLLITFPIFLAFLQLIPAVARQRNWLLPVALLLLAVAGYFVVLGHPGHTELLASTGVGIEFRLGIDPMGTIFSLMVLGLWVLATIYGLGYIEKEGQGRFFAYYTMTLGVTLGLAFSSNLVTYYLFYELLTLTTYPLVVFSGTREARRAGRIYIFFSFIGAALALTGAFILYRLVGTWDFVAGGIVTREAFAAAPIAFIASFTLLFAGFGVKGALLIFHYWLPAAMVAPTPVSALLHAVAVVKAGVFGLLRLVLYVFGPTALAAFPMEYFYLWVGATIVLGAFKAMREDVLKRRLAYSTISHLSYIVMGSLFLTAHGAKGSMFHLLAHALAKITLFFSVGIITYETGCKKMSELAGIGRRLPWTVTAFALASASLVGLPLTGGFISKWNLLTGGIHSAIPFLAGIFMIGSMANAFYLFPLPIRGFLKKGDFPRRQGWETTPYMLIPTVLLAFLAFFLGLASTIPLQVVDQVVATVFPS